MASATAKSSARSRSGSRSGSRLSFPKPSKGKKAKASKPSKPAKEKPAKGSKPTTSKECDPMSLDRKKAAERLRTIYDLEKDLEGARARYDVACRARKSAKADLDEAEEALNKEIRDQRQGPGPLFNADGSGAATEPVGTKPKRERKKSSGKVSGNGQVTPVLHGRFDEDVVDADAADEDDDVSLADAPLSESLDDPVLAIT